MISFVILILSCAVKSIIMQVKCITFHRTTPVISIGIYVSAQGDLRKQNVIEFSRYKISKGFVTLLFFDSSKYMKIKIRRSVCLCGKKPSKKQLCHY